jgi:hypothetical protein
MMKVLQTTLLFLIVPVIVHAGMGTSYQGTGHLGLEVTGVAGGNFTQANGTLTLTANIPATAMIKFAMLYASQTNQGAGLDATFAGNNLGTVGPTGTDIQLLGMYSYHWPVHLYIVPGQNSYNFTVGFNTQNAAPIAGVALVVVWEELVLEPTRTITVIDGMQQVGESGQETETVSFTSATTGATDVWVFTVNDDNLATNETVSYNGNNIGGPLDRNLGFDASLLKMVNAQSLASSNSLSISTISDHMGWMIGATAITWPPVNVEASTWGSVKGLYREP